MIRRVAFLVLVVMLFPLSLGAQETVTAEVAPAPPETTVVDETERARIDWTEGYIEAQGEAVAPAGKADTAQGKLLARRGAVVDLQRNLLEFLQGVRVDSRTTMRDFMASDVVRTEVQGMIKNVEILEAF